MIVALVGISQSCLPSSRVCVSSSTISTSLPVILRSNTKIIRMKHPSSYCSSIHISCTAMSLAVARCSSVTAAKAREVCEMYAVSIVILGAELGRPSIRLMLNSSHNVTKRVPSRCFVIKSAGLPVQRIFSIVSSRRQVRTT